MTRRARDVASALLALAGIVVLVYAALGPPAKTHPVTPTMTASAKVMSGRKVSALEAEGSDGRKHSPAADSRDRPLVLFFIQDGCPCSEAADPYFGRLARAYASRASFLGIIDGDPPVARSWSERHRAPYPILADPERRLIASLRAERSAYVMLIAPGARIEALWPGYSSGMLVDLGARLARLTTQPEVPLETAGAPAEMTSGCAF
jgi:peroxiredoxin